MSKHNQPWNSDFRKQRRAGLRKHIDFTVIPLPPARCQRATRRRFAPPGRLITPEGLDGILEQEAAIIERFFPGAEFRLVPLSNGNFNFVQITPCREPESSLELPAETVANAS